MADLALEKSSDETVIRYERVGASIVQNDFTEKVLVDICNARNDGAEHFFLVDGPSGCGKTQFVFFLRAQGFNVVHVLLTGVSTQPIYRHIQELSELFIRALNTDLGQLEIWKPDEPLEVQSIQSSSFDFATVAFIFSVLGVDRVGQTTTVGDLQNHLRSLKKMNKDAIPVFVLDEVLSAASCSGRRLEATDVDVQILRLARNLLRSVGIVAILMGTNSSAANFIASAQHSRSGKENIWCKLITRPPRPSLKSLEMLGVTTALENIRGVGLNYQSLCKFFSDQFMTCLPWFAELFVEAVSDLADLDASDSPVKLMDKLLLKMATAVLKRKTLVRSREGLRGQVCMNLPAHLCDRYNTSSSPQREANPEISPVGKKQRKRGPNRGGKVARKATIKQENGTNSAMDTFIGRSNSSYFVGCHFAYLTDENGDLFVSESQLMQRDSDSDDSARLKVWDPRAFFPQACDDALLYLLLGGGGGDDFPPSFTHPQNHTTLGTHAALVYLRGAYAQELAACSLGYGNPVARSRDGNLLEVLCCLAIQMASHRCGLQGVPFNDFVRLVVAELLLVGQPLHWKQKGRGVLRLQPLFEDYKVPYMSPCNNPWPEGLGRIAGCNVGNLNRTPDKDRIDFSVGKDMSGNDISGEAKNYEGGVNTDVMRQMLERIPEESKVHLIFCSSLQKSYFKKRGSWERVVQNNAAMKTTNVVKVVISQNTTNELQYAAICPRMSLLNEYERLVVIFPVDTLCGVN